MRLEPSRSAVTASLTAAMASRLFCGLALDAPEATNAAWLAAPLGLALSLPLVWLICRRGMQGSWILAGLLFIAITVDAACAVEWTAYSESCLAFDHVSPILMMLPLLLAILRCVLLGGDAVCGAARIWIGLFTLLIAIVVVYQLPYYNAGWLRPWLGAGMAGLNHAGLRVAGWNALLAGSAAMICKNRLSFRETLPPMLLATAVAALLVMLRQMMAPVAVQGSTDRSIRIDALLTNGRAPLYLQLPMIVAWFAGMLHLMVYESIAACALLRRALPRFQEKPSIIVGLGAVFTLALLRIPRDETTRRLLPYLYHALAIVAILPGSIKKRGSKCAASA